MIILLLAVFIVIPNDYSILIPILTIGAIDSLLILLSIGKINIDQRNKLINIKNISNNISLHYPIHYTKWWDYDYDSQSSSSPFMMEGNYEKEDARSNDIDSFLIITDSNGMQVVFRETIYLDSRFPNESNFIPNRQLNNMPIISIQRTDKLLSYFKLNLGDENLSEVI